MKSFVCFALAVIFAGISVWMFLWGAQSALPVSSECTFTSFLIIENPDCGWSRVAFYGSRATLGVALLFTLPGLIFKRREQEGRPSLAFLEREHNTIIYS
jgi:hypothetical protein